MINKIDLKEVAGDKSRLLNSQEQAALRQITAQDSPFGQRAQALLAIDQGVTQPAAAQLSGLTLGQVRYWLEKFRKDRLSIFPTELLEEPQAPVETPPGTLAPAPVPEIPGRAAIAEAEVKEEGVDVEETADPLEEAPTPPAEPAAEKKQPKKKSSKTKKAKKEKKGKKGKKDKKGKKSKKKSKEEKPKKKKKGKKKKKKGQDAKGKPGKKKKK